jgi:hypothetical protein
MSFSPLLWLSLKTTPFPSFSAKKKKKKITNKKRQTKRDNEREGEHSACT